MLNFPPWKVLSIIATVVVGLFFSLPNVIPADMRASIPVLSGMKPMTLGLDLQGGSHVLLEVDRADLNEQLSRQLIGDVRQNLREAKIKYSGLGKSDDGVSVRITDPADMERATTELRKLVIPVGPGILTGAGTSGTNVELTTSTDHIYFTFTQAGIEDKISRAIQQSLEILGKRIDALGTTEPSIQRQGVDRILIQVPGLQDPSRLKDLLGKTAKLQFRLLCETQPSAEGQRPPADCDEMAMQKEPANKMWVQTSTRATVEGGDLTDAQPGFDQRNGEAIVSFRFNQSGALRFAQLTQQNVGRPFAIVLDNEVVSAPVINEPILGGSGQISGRFSTQEANDLAIVLRSGALPAKLTIVEERTVGPSLGSDSVRAGLIASIVGLIGVMAFMVLAYGLFGIFANIGLLAHMVILVGALSALGATLTLPGIAGMVLTMGIAVDSNVLVYERIREEQRAGRSVVSSIEVGFSKALATVVDSNVTAFIAVVILFGLGSGPIRGFAVTLGIGILTTVLTAYTMTRLIIVVWMRRTRPKVVPL